MYGTEFEQETEIAGEASDSAASDPIEDGVTAARQETWTVAETLNEALTVAAATGVTTGPDARMPKARSGNVIFMVTALPPARTNT